MSPGTYLAFPYFITKTGLTTQAGPIVKFTIPANTSALQFDRLAIGPTNVVARGIAFTGANGGRYFTLPIVPRINGEVLGTATVIYDNVTTSGTMNFTNDAILSGQAVDIPGNNLIQQIALNLPRGVNWYGAIACYGLEKQIPSSACSIWAWTAERSLGVPILWDGPESVPYQWFSRASCRC